jgi:signal transduction histidine kinase
VDRILRLMDQKENRRLLAEWLAAHYEVATYDAGQALEGSFDLTIVDGTVLDRLAGHIQPRRQAEHPRFLPYLFVTARQDVGLVTRHLWKTIDEIINSPIDKVELLARVEVLLRARRLSVELRAAHDGLEVRVADRTRDLASANEALQGAARRKGQFLAMLAHELRNPLAPIRNGLQILKSSGDDRETGPSIRRPTWAGQA